MIAADLQRALTRHRPVSDLVGDRVYPMNLPQAPTLPAITYQRISTTRVSSQDGPSGLARPRFQIDCWATKYTTADAVAEAVRGVLDGLRNVDDGGAIQGSFSDGDRDLWDSDLKLYGRSVDFLVWHEE